MDLKLDQLAAQSHRRLNPLTGEWTLVAPGRTGRPWQGEAGGQAPTKITAYDPSCYLCPGNTRVSSVQNMDYKGPYVFTNDTPSLVPNSSLESCQDPLFQTMPATGTARVVCFSERHDLTLAELPVEAVLKVIDTWCRESQELGKSHQVVQIFENKGSMMGCSNPHPHGQIWASDFLPQEIMKEDERQRAYYEIHREPLLLASLRQEQVLGTRMVTENDNWAVVVPFWALWPFETLVIPKQPLSWLEVLDRGQRGALAEILSRLLQAYDRLFATSFPYSMGWHAAPYTSGSKEYFQLHAHYYPPLLRSATVKKHMVGYEMLAERGRDTTPEQAAEQLRGCL